MINFTIFAKLSISSHACAFFPVFYLTLSIVEIDDGRIRVWGSIPSWVLKLKWSTKEFKQHACTHHIVLIVVILMLTLCYSMMSTMMSHVNIANLFNSCALCLLEGMILGRLSLYNKYLCVPACQDHATYVNVHVYLRTYHNKLHSKLCNNMLVTTKVHMILRSGVVSTQMRDKKEVVYHVTLWYVVSCILYAKGLKQMARGLKVSHQLIVHMTLFVNVSNVWEWKHIGILGMTFLYFDYTRRKYY